MQFYLVCVANYINIAVFINQLNHGTKLKTRRESENYWRHLIKNTEKPADRKLLLPAMGMACYDCQHHSFLFHHLYGNKKLLLDLARFNDKWGNCNYNLCLKG